MSFTTHTTYDAEQKIWSGPKTSPKYGTKTNLGSEMVKSLSKNPDKVIQIMATNDEKLTAGELLQASKLIAQKFLELGLKPGDVIGLFADNTKNLSAIVLAALLCGTPWNALFPEFDKATIQQIFGITTPKLVCCDVEKYELIKSALEEMKSEAPIWLINGRKAGVFSVEDILECERENVAAISFPGLQLDGDATAAILCSSGTTGNPKGVRVSHNALLNNFVIPDVTADTILFAFSKFFWISAVWTYMASLLNNATRVVTNEPATTENFLRIIEKYQVTHTLSSTQSMTQLVLESMSKPNISQRLSCLHVLCFGGTKVPTIVSEKLFKLFNCDVTKPGPLIGYGMTELGGMFSATYTGDTTKMRRYDTEGKLYPNMQGRIKDVESGEIVGPNKMGYILKRSPYKWAGYYRNAEATKKAYDENGWINSGDIGYFDDEGFLHICGRDSDIFRTYHNHNIYPNRLEDLIMKVEGVAEVCIFAIPDLLATNLTACAVVRAKNLAGEKLTSKDIEDYVKENVAEMYYITGGVYFMESLPKTSSGKVLRRKVYELIKSSKEN